MNTKPLIIGLGNELLGDDGIGITAARKLRADNTVRADIIDCNLSGISLLDVLSGYSKAIFIDAVRTKKHDIGDIVELNVNDFRSIPSVSPHHTGLPELIDISRALGMEFPDEIKIIAVEVEDCCTVGASLSKAVESAMDTLLKKVKLYLQLWKGDYAIT
ncbi:MAG: hydrogenase maturation protease [Candidatus Zixiibacteriota bacterium]|nr:MAG: hydrogenase maturation protease [candidate division Zixibacteria bacterium]